MFWISKPMLVTESGCGWTPYALINGHNHQIRKLTLTAISSTLWELWNDYVALLGPGIDFTPSKYFAEGIVRHLIVIFYNYQPTSRIITKKQAQQYNTLAKLTLPTSFQCDLVGTSTSRFYQTRKRGNTTFAEGGRAVFRKNDFLNTNRKRHFIWMASHWTKIPFK